MLPEETYVGGREGKEFLGRGTGYKGKEEPAMCPGARQSFVCPVFNLMLLSPPYR